MKTLCICEICNCGRHRCPHRPSTLHRKGTVTGVSEYTHKYPGYEGYMPPKSLKPKYEYKHCKEMMESTTTFKADYVAHEVTPRVIKKKVPYKPKTGTIDHNTTYRVQYKPYKVQPVVPLRPEETTLRGIGKMDTVSTYQDYFRQWEVSKRELMKPDRIYKPSKQPFQDLTTYRQYHQGRTGPKSKSFKPDYVKVGSEAPLQSSTEFRDQYREWPVTIRPVRKAQKYKGPTAKMDLCTTTHTDFIRHEIQSLKPVRPIVNLALSKAPFNDQTTMREDYRLWEIKRRTPIITTREIPRPRGKMEDLTTFRAHFTEKPLQKVMSYKPVYAPLMAGVPLDANTTYRTEYTPKEIVLCPARLKCPEGFAFVGVNGKGHRHFRKLADRDQMAMLYHDLDPNDGVVKLTDLE